MNNTFDRRDFLKLVPLAATSYAISGCIRQSATSPKAGLTRPNIIFIMADDLGYADLGCYGQKLIHTPSIDRMAAEGMRFTQCYAGSTVCAPSRSVLMTGRHTGHTRVRGNFGKQGGVLVLDNGPPQRRVPLQPEDTTIAEVLKQAGYTTAITGKWGLGEPDTPGVPKRKGFDHWLGYLNQRRAHTYYPPYLWQNEEKLILEANKDKAKGCYSHDLFTDFALSFIREHKAQPFFLYLAYTLPHAKFEIPDTAPYTDKPWPENAKAYAAMTAKLDTDVGRVLDLLKALQIDQRTIVFFCSDNGAAPRPWPNIFDSCGPLRGKKQDLYEGGIRVPMIVRWPGRVPSGVESNTVWYFADVMPTLAELAHVSPPKNIDGVSILPTLLDRKQDLHDRFLYWEYHARNFSQAVRWRNFKAVRQSPDQPLELYNLEKDLAEQHNVAHQYPQIIEQIEDYLRTARTETPCWPVK